jgi:hypothetical protein
VCSVAQAERTGVTVEEDKTSRLPQPQQRRNRVPNRHEAQSEAFLKKSLILTKSGREKYSLVCSVAQAERTGVTVEEDKTWHTDKLSSLEGKDRNFMR